MPEQLLNVLKLCLLVLLYLFFLRVVRAVWVEVDGPRLRTSGRRSAGGPDPVAVGAGASPSPSRRPADHGSPVTPSLVVLAPAEAAGRRHPLGHELTLGRAVGCQIPLEDTYVSQLHARIFLRDGAFYVEDLGSTNGTFLNGRRVAGPLLLQSGDQVRVGSTVLELEL